PRLPYIRRLPDQAGQCRLQGADHGLLRPGWRAAADLTPLRESDRMSARGFGTLSALPLAIAALLNASVGAAQQAGTVEGRVTDAHTGEPLSGVLIEATGAEGPVISDRQGRWRLQLTPGSHRLTASFI